MKKNVIIYGTFDFFHAGHINILKRAREVANNMGGKLIVGVTSCEFDKQRGKYNVFNTTEERVESVKKSGFADDIVIEEYVGQKIDDIKRYNVGAIVFGSDWINKMDYLKEYCNVIYFPRTEGISSTMLREKYAKV